MIREQWGNPELGTRLAGGATRVYHGPIVRHNASTLAGGQNTPCSLQNR
jgi:hypothetical protein